MTAPFPIDDSAVEYLMSTLKRFSDRARHSISLEYLLEQWERLVRQVEDGYRESIYEYANDVSVRNLLKIIEDEGPISLRATLAAYLEPIDQRFLSATVQSVHGLPGLNADSPWSKRIPKEPEGELLEDLRSEGLVL